MITLVTITFNLEQVDHLLIQGPSYVTVPRTGYLAEQQFYFRGVTKQSLLAFIERREARTNDSQLRLEGLEENHHG